MKAYYAGHTRITDDSLAIWGVMDSLVGLAFWQCTDLTDAGIAHLAGVPNLREVSLDRLPGVAKSVLAVLPPRVRVNYTG